MNTTLEKLYIEPTNHCNLFCETCLRNSWESKFAELPLHFFAQLAEQIPDHPDLKTIVLAGFGEPLCHPQIVEIVSLLSATGVNVEIISNAALLDKEFAERLTGAGLARLWVSVDGASAEKYEQVRLGARHDVLAENLIAFSEIQSGTTNPVKLGLSFVATTSSLNELQDIVNLACRLHADILNVSHVLPYTPEMNDQILFTNRRNTLPEQLEVENLEIRLPAPLLDSFSTYNESNPTHTDYCKFVRENCMIIGADGRVAPCLALIYQNKTYLHGYERTIEPVSFGNVLNTPLLSIWNDPDYSTFRQRVAEFEFSPCTTCGGCEKLESNQEDCFDNRFPVCGACLWAQGVIQCP